MALNWHAFVLKKGAFLPTARHLDQAHNYRAIKGTDTSQLGSQEGTDPGTAQGTKDGTTTMLISAEKGAAVLAGLQKLEEQVFSGIIFFLIIKKI